jgi:hypothetical protein
MTPELNKKIISLDEQMTEIVLAAERSQLPRQFKTDWSVVIHNQSLICKFRAIIVKGTWNRIDTTIQSIEIYSKLPQQLQLQIDNISNYRFKPILRRICQNQLRQATRYHKQLIKIHRELRQQGLLTLKTIRECEDNAAVVEIIRKIMQFELHTQDLSIIKSL